MDYLKMIRLKSRRNQMVLVLISFILFVVVWNHGCKKGDKGTHEKVVLQINNDTDSSLLAKAHQLFEKDSVVQSLEYTQRALYLSQMAENSQLEVKILNLQGYIFLYWHDYESSLDLFLGALAEARKNPGSFELLSTLYGLGRTYNLMKDCDKAEVVLFEALEITRNSKMKREEGKIHVELGNTYTETREYDKALEHLFKALQLSQGVSDSVSMIYTLNNIGQVYNHKNEHEKAFEFLNRSMEFNQNLQNPQAKSASLGNLGEVFIAQGRYDEAIDFINQSLSISIKQGFNVFTRDNYLLLSQAYEKSGRLRDALEYYQRFAEMGDSLYNEDKNRAIQGIMSKYAQAEKDQKIALLEQQTRNRTLFLWLTLSLASLAIAVLILVFVSLRLRIKLHNKERHQLDETISQKNRELVSLMMQAGQKRKMMDELEKTLEKLTATDMQDLKGFADEIKGKIKSTHDIDTDWEVLKTHFEEVHPDFFKTLIRNHPDLSQYDLKLCAYIRINLTTKEIARLLNISDRSVQTAKYRIKKKMELPSNVDLITYINSH
jgi:tetratricopeptide (TPR) repeat protein